MASASPASSALLILCFCFISVNAVGADWRGRKVGGRSLGGRSPVADVQSNEEVQELGNFAVEYYNRKLRGEGERRLSFWRVVGAQTQVVSGIKYYLKVVVDGGGRYDAVVWVKPWVGHRELLSFTPAAPVSH